MPIEDQKKLRDKEIASAPPKCRGVLERAYSGDSRAAGVKAFCLHCVGYERKDVTNCTSWACPLWEYRPFQRNDEVEDE